jgi:serine/threonine-protein kinase
VCRATQAAHTAGVIHRDLKPGNILIDTLGNPHVTDFGLAVRSQAPEVLVQMNGTILGTPSYMAPEQARGDVDHIGEQTDVYALGVVLYEMLTGRRPFIASDSKSVLYRIQTEDPVRPRSLDPAIPSDLERICLRAMQKNPDDRYASAAEMGDDLENFLNGFPIKARAGWPMHRLTKWITRNRTLTTAGVVVVLLSGISAAMFMQKPGHVSDTVPVTIQTNPPATQMEFQRYDEFLRVPAGEPVGIPLDTQPGAVIRLQSGLYRVRATAPEGRAHEVWRFVPKPGEAKSLDQLYPHKAWTANPDGVVKLQGFRLFTDEEVSIPMEAVGGGEFTLGTEDPSGFSEAHRHPVDDLLVGINEVTEAEFERVLQDAQLPEGTGTYLDMVDSVFGSEWRSHPDRPVTGYPRDVAILFCELAGGRLPNHAEWEYVATREGADKYSTGTGPPPIPLASWDVTPVTADTPDLRMPSGLRGLCSNAAEWTDSVCVSYRLLYPNHIVRPIDARPDPDKLAILSQAHEVRGGDQQWIDGQPAQEAPSARTRAVSYVVDGTDADSHTTRARIGWRMFRTRHRTNDHVETAASK